MKVHATQAFLRKVKKITLKNKSLQQKYIKQLRLFKIDPHHPALRFHKLKGERNNEYAIRIEGDLRAICIWEKENFIFFDLVTHDEY